MSAMRTLLAVSLCAALLAGMTGCGQGAGKADAPAHPVSIPALDDSGQPLRDEFNQARDSVRLLFVVDPACPTCLRGLADLNDALLANTHDARLQTYVVHLPVIGGTAADIPGAAALLRTPNVRHYWNASGQFGRDLTKVLGLKRGDEDVYAWDVWMIYAPGVVWSERSPPRPRLMMHQLWTRFADYAYLDAKAFAQDVRGLLAQAPAATAR